MPRYVKIWRHGDLYSQPHFCPQCFSGVSLSITLYDDGLPGLEKYGHKCTKCGCLWAEAKPGEEGAVVILEPSK